MKIHRGAPAILVLFALAACGPISASTPSPGTSAAGLPSPATTVWHIVASPNISSTGENEFDGVSCVTSGDCWGVGQTNANNSTGSRTLAEHWNGAAWGVVAVPDAATAYGDLEPEGFTSVVMAQVAPFQ